MEIWRHGDKETLRLGDMETCGYQTEDGKRKPRQFSLICLTFAHRGNGSLSAVHWLMKKKTEVIHCKRTKRTNRACPSKLNS
jgi:hypothetical protein